MSLGSRSWELGFRDLLPVRPSGYPHSDARCPMPDSRYPVPTTFPYVTGIRARSARAGREHRQLEQARQALEHIERVVCTVVCDDQLA
jgi:hypothetical protein